MRHALTVSLALLALCADAALAARAPKPIPRAQLQGASRYSKEHDGLALLVWQRGRIVLEQYDNGAKQGDRNRLASITKNFWALAAAIGVQEGWLRFDERASDTLPEWKDDPVRSRIELRQLLAMVSGLDPGYSWLDRDDVTDKLRASLVLPSVTEPGTQFVYGPANMAVFGEVLRRKLAARHDTPFKFLTRRVLHPLGIKDPEWRTDLAGNPLMASGAYMTARDMLALGRLFLRAGTYHGRRVVSTRALGQLLEPGTVNPLYGMTVWLNRRAAIPETAELDVEQILGTGAPYDGWTRGCLSHRAPHDMLVLLGSYNQRVYVFPSQELVIVRQGRGTNFKDSEFLGLLFP